MKTRIWFRPLLSVLAFGLISPSVSAQQASVNVSVSGLRSQKGNIVVCLWKQQEKDFPICASGVSSKIVTVKASGSTVTATFRNVEPGQYAISAFHDENQDGKIKRGLMGQPKEGISFSNMNGKPKKGDRPSFEKSKFSVNGNSDVSMSLIYF